MKILLIYPYCLEERLHAEDASVVPIGLYYVGALLKENNYDVEILNWYNIKRDEPKIKKILIENNPDVIGLSILHANRWGGIEIARIAKQVCPGVTIVLGGIGATFLWEHLLRNFKEIDLVVIGEGEHTFLNLIKPIERKGFDDLKNIRGIAFRNGDAVEKTEDADVVQDLDTLPNPAKYFIFQHLSSTRGCPGNCTFCGSPRFWGHKVRFHSPDYFVTQIELLYRKGIDVFYFSDDTFTINKGRVIEICKKILERSLNITWMAISRVNYIDEEAVCWMRKAGCVQISFGVESGSKKIRALLNKKISADQIKRAFELTTKYGILARAYFIYGSPGENQATIQKTINLIHEIKPLGIIFYILDIFPGTELYMDFKKRTGVTDDIWLKRIEDIMYFETDPRLTGEMILDFGERLRKEYYTSLGGFADAVKLVEKKELFKLHSDFLSRLGMTFSHGDYANIKYIRDKEKISERLYKKSLEYYPDKRACLGLGIINQKTGNHKESIRIMSEGLVSFPEDEQLNICMGVSYMNLNEYEKALSYLLKIQHSKDALYYIAACYNALGDSENEAAFVKKSRFTD